MASKYRKQGSPFWWIRLKCPVTGRPKDVSSKLRWDNAQETKKCDARLALTNVEETRHVDGGERWEAWVETFFDTCVPDDTTRRGYRQGWAWVRSFLIEKGIATPREVTYQLGLEFLAWRKTHGVKKITQATTAFRDLKVWRKLTNHAVRCGFTQGNPLNRMGLPRPEHAKKMPYSDEDVAQVYAAFAKHCTEYDWKFVSFRFGLELGIRLSGTQIPWSNVDFDRNIIKVVGKRSNGKSKDYLTIIPSSLREWLLRLKARGGDYTCVLPANASTLVNKFIQRMAKLPNHCFHATRLTFNVRLERNAAITGRVAMQALNHSSPAVHAVYSRPSVEELRVIDGKVLYPPVPVFERQSADDTTHQSLLA
jgi:integrase